MKKGDSNMYIKYDEEELDDYCTSSLLDYLVRFYYPSIDYLRQMTDELNRNFMRAQEDLLHKKNINMEIYNKEVVRECNQIIKFGNNLKDFIERNEKK